jgi:hypothetical protein
MDILNISDIFKLLRFLADLKREVEEDYPNALACVSLVLCFCLAHFAA